MVFLSHRVFRRIELDNACKALSTVFDLYTAASMTLLPTTVELALRLQVSYTSSRGQWNSIRFKYLSILYKASYQKFSNFLLIFIITVEEGDR